MSWSFFDPEELLARLHEEPEARRVDLREALALILEDPFQPQGVEIHPPRGVDKGDQVDVLVAYLPHGWLATYEVHVRRSDRDGGPRIVLIAVTRLAEVLDI